MRHARILPGFVAVVATFCCVVWAADCNQNTISDALEVQPRFETTAVCPLANEGMVFMAWWRDTGVAVGDLDGDGDADLVTANSGSYEQPCASVSILLNRGDGTYAPEALVPVGAGPLDAVLADLDGDGDLDIAAASVKSGEVSIVLNDGHAAFSAGTPMALEGVSELAAADLDGDGDCDLVAMGSERVTVCLNDGAGRFTPTLELRAADGVRYLYPTDVAVADVDGDGRNDVLASDRVLAVWRNTGGGAFAEPVTYNLVAGNPGFCWTHTLVPVELNGDGSIDLVTADYTDGGTPSVSVVLNRGDGTFAEPVPYYIGYSTETQWAAAADLDLDGDADILAAVGNTVRMLLNRGDGSFDDPGYLNWGDAYEDLGLSTSCVMAADLDGDAFPDAAVMGWQQDAREIRVMANRLPAVDRDHDGVLDVCEPGFALVDYGEEWKFFRGRTAPPGPGDWRGVGYDDGAWEQGPTGIGYGDFDDSTVLADMAGSYVSVFCRKAFEVHDPAAFGALTFDIVYDDGFIAYLNGREIARANMPGAAGEEVGFDQTALSAQEPGEVAHFALGDARALLLAGRNVLAVQVHNNGIQSTDLSFIPALRAAPGAAPQLSAGSAEIAPGGDCRVPVRLTSARAAQAFSFGLAHDPSVVSLTAIDYVDCPSVAALNDGTGPDFFSVDLDAGTVSCGAGVTAGGTVYCIASQASPAQERIAAGEALPIVRATYRAAQGAAAGARSALDIVGCLGDGAPWAAVVVIDYASVSPVATSGAITVTAPVEVFLRGDANADARRDIADAVLVLGYLFGGATDRVSCLDAADANDDGAVDIADAIAVLRHLFTSAGPLPAPFGQCGPDPTADALVCAGYSPCE